MKPTRWSGRLRARCFLREMGRWPLEMGSALGFQSKLLLGLLFSGNGSVGFLLKKGGSWLVWGSSFGVADGWRWETEVSTRLLQMGNFSASRACLAMLWDWKPPISPESPTQTKSPKQLRSSLFWEETTTLTKTPRTEAKKTQTNQTPKNRRETKPPSLTATFLNFGSILDQVRAKHKEAIGLLPYAQ